MERKLTAIMAADVVGYSRLMGADEAGTLAALQALRAEVVDPTIAEHRGRIVKLMGDGALVEFASVVDALECAVVIQRGMNERDPDVPAERRIAFRIGINLGDIIVDGDDIYGNGVNVAARLEALAEPGGICLSGRVLDQVKGNVDVGFASLGPQTVKNIEDPINAYKVLFDTADAGRIVGAPKAREPGRPWLIAAVVALVVAVGGAGLWYHQTKPDFAPAAVAKMAYPLPDKPSIAVLPFENFSGEKQDDFIAKGLTEDIITALSQLPQLFVISRTSSFAFKDKTVTATEIAEQLGVRYIVEGSIQRSGDTLRINAQLIDAVGGHHLWADNFDGAAKDLFALQDDIVRRILVELQVKLTGGDHARVASRGTTNLDAWLLRMQAMAELYKFTRESTIRTRELLQRAHETDPTWARPLGGLAFTYWWEARKGWTDDREEWIRKGMELAEQAIEMDPNDTLGYMQLGNLYQLKGDHDRAIALREKAVEIAPNDYQTNWGLGSVLFTAGQAERAVEVLKHAERLSPRHPAQLTRALARAQLLAGRYEDAIETAKRASARVPDHIDPHQQLTAAYSALGRMQEAQAASVEVLRIDPKFTVSGWKRQNAHYKDRAAVDRLAGLLIKAGLPEEPPLPLPDKPSIAVLPFDNFSDDPKLEFFVSGLTEDLTAALSKAPGMFVIARNSAATYKGKPVDVKQVARELGVQYVLEGSVQKAGDKLRITAQLVDALNGRHLWSDRFDREAKDVFALQDEIVMRVFVELQVKLTEGDRARVSARSSNNLESWLLGKEGYREFIKFTREGMIRARELFEAAHQADPNSGRLIASIALTHWYEARRHWSASRDESIRQGVELAERAIELDPDDPLGYQALGNLYVLLGQLERGIELRRKAVELAPNDFSTVGGLAVRLNEVGKEQEAIELFEHAMRLSPKHPWWVPFSYGLSLHLVGRKEEAVETYQKAIALSPKSANTHARLAAVYVDLDQMDEARAAADEATRLNPKLTASRYMKSYSLHDPARDAWYKDLLVQAGLPE